MKTTMIVLLLLPLADWSGPLSAQVKPQPAPTNMKRSAPALPPLPAGVKELKFTDFFVQPVGDRGLELTDTLRKMEGQRVRILGYMAQQEQPVPGMFLFNAIPVRLNEEHYGLAEDLPGATLFVHMPKDREKVVSHTPGLMLLTGVLSIGNREEADGRISTVRLALEVPATKKNPSSSTKGAERLVMRAR